jgi:phytanoyl-CoA hydroxylase
MQLLNAELKARFDRDGYAVLPGWLNADELQKLKGEVERFLRDGLPALPPGAAVREIKDRPETLKLVPLPAATDPYFNDLRSKGKFRDLADLTLGRPSVTQALTWMNKPAKVGSDTPPHQDGYYYMLQPSEAVAMWLALEDADETNGCMRYIPGSHLRGMRRHGRSGTLGFSQGISDYSDADRQAEVAIPARPGDIIVHHCLTIHRADANLSNRERKAIQLVYFSDRAKEDVERKAAYQAQLKAELAKSGRV